MHRLPTKHPFLLSSHLSRSYRSYSMLAGPQFMQSMELTGQVVSLLDRWERLDPKYCQERMESMQKIVGHMKYNIQDYIGTAHPELPQTASVQFVNGMASFPLLQLGTCSFDVVRRTLCTREIYLRRMAYQQDANMAERALWWIKGGFDKQCHK
ncbi:hypothetical protein BC936DRAFT_145333 [Jimgerdemannia flammicorona]|uniref:Uncharacterized protein n=1 Tax=Jimgerdemannia flammicorona TaxID=994334 RepID=A0A433DAB2_9FUNG|nr:hypothetical protein BC936DRAFT_145333 [Jimgerdemannia flammicorona]